MPAIRSAKTRKAPPDGFDDIEDTLLEFSNKMKDAENASHEGRKKHEMQWPIFQITHQRSRTGTRRESDREVEEAGVREAVLPPVHSDQGDELQQHVHLPCAPQTTEGGSGDRVRELRVSRLLQQ
ncbi:hypothetical protein B0A55_01640 [Friedmanniomyces simplex]|uniref:Uncharacterized protein n=1 Tax=Friedmanniomyces simplex TaxID=329884 RepID=A0A4U0XZK2_9PEZI|nr:hypothetical protein B0A55_01640 [Friedmanniomyces simplex]